MAMINLYFKNPNNLEIPNHNHGTSFKKYFLYSKLYSNEPIHKFVKMPITKAIRIFQLIDFILAVITLPYIYFESNWINILWSFLELVCIASISIAILLKNHKLCYIYLIHQVCFFFFSNFANEKYMRFLCC